MLLPQKLSMRSDVCDQFPREFHIYIIFNLCHRRRKFRICRQSSTSEMVRHLINPNPDPNPSPNPNPNPNHNPNPNPNPNPKANPNVKSSHSDVIGVRFMEE